MTEFWAIHNDQPTVDPVRDKAVRIGWDEIGDLSVLEPTREAFKQSVMTTYPDDVKSVAAWAGTLYRFVHQLSVGDIVVCPDRSTRTVEIGRVAGPYEYHPEYRLHTHWRPVAWISTKVSRDLLSRAAQDELGSATTLFNIKTSREEIEHIISTPNVGSDVSDFSWVPFYEQLADAVMRYRFDRPALLDKLWHAAAVSGVEHLFKYLRTDQLKDGSRGPISDIDPFTAFSPFNRGIKDSARAAIAAAYGEEFGIRAEPPTKFLGIPVVNNMNSWFIGWTNERGPDDVDNLWALAESAMQYVRKRDENTRESLVAAFDTAAKGNTRQLSMGLYWIRPNDFAAYDQVNSRYLAGEYPNVSQGLALQAKITGDEFLSNTEAIRSWIDSERSFTSVPQLSLAAWRHAIQERSDDDEGQDPIDSEASNEPAVLTNDVYTLDSIIDDACFLARSDLQKLKDALLAKKNLILQGPPGTGKTWLARRLAWAVCNEKGSDRVVAIQFHPSLAYEDFVRGWRPGPGSLVLTDGPFISACERARSDPDRRPHILLIEEINRGNPAQIFGELLTLLESDKRDSRNSLQLAYPRSDGERFFVPPNLYVIGTMNLADRSLALVDMALRRRFAFVELEPQFGSVWSEHVSGLGYDLTELEGFGARIGALNKRISDDRMLGRQFCIGHSFFTPSEKLGDMSTSTGDWLRPDLGQLSRIVDLVAC